MKAILKKFNTMNFSHKQAMKEECFHRSFLRLVMTCIMYIRPIKILYSSGSRIGQGAVRNFFRDFANIVKQSWVSEVN